MTVEIETVDECVMIVGVDLRHTRWWLVVRGFDRDGGLYNREFLSSCLLTLLCSHSLIMILHDAGCKEAFCGGCVYDFEQRVSQGEGGIENFCSHGWCPSSSTLPP